MDVIVLLNHVEPYDDKVVMHHQMKIDHKDYIDNHDLDIDAQLNVYAF